MNSTYKICNRVKRCFMGSVTPHRQFLTQSVQPTNQISLHRTDCYTSKCHLWKGAACKRFYCGAVEEQVKPSSHERYQQQLDEYVSDPENKKRFQILELEVDVLRHNAEMVPSSIKARQWMALIKLPSKSQRIKYLRFLWRNEKINDNEKAEKAAKNAEWAAKKEAAAQEPEEDTGEMKYGLQYNTLFLRIYQTTMSHCYNGKLMNAIMFEPKFVLDCGYEDHMTYREIHNCAKQLQMTFATNRLHVSPVHLHFCNLKQGGQLEDFMVLNIPTFLDVDFPATITSQSYLDLFPKDQLVYLTPHCKTEMTEYDPDMVYIIGAMVDKVHPQPLSMAKAKREGIRMAKLPLEKYLDWGSGSTKSFTINQMMMMMLDLKHTKDWHKALQHVPTRKLRPAREHLMKKKLLRSMHFVNQQEKLEKTYDTRERTYGTQERTYGTREKTYGTREKTYGTQEKTCGTQEKTTGTQEKTSGIRDFTFANRKNNFTS